jgi:hypothetical protein
MWSPSTKGHRSHLSGRLEHLPDEAKKSTLKSKQYESLSCPAAPFLCHHFSGSGHVMSFTRPRNAQFVANCQIAFSTVSLLFFYLKFRIIMCLITRYSGLISLFSGKLVVKHPQPTDHMLVVRCDTPISFCPLLKKQWSSISGHDAEKIPLEGFIWR